MALTDTEALRREYNRDYSRMTHRAGDTACWDRHQLNDLLGRLDGRLIHTAYVPDLTLIKRVKLGLGRLLGWRNKIYLYLFVPKADSAGKAR